MGTVNTSVPDPNPDPPDPHDFGPPGSGLISQMYGSGSFLSSRKTSKENLVSYCFVTSFGLFLKNDVNVGTFKK
jgi:hypothetical protein